MSVFECKRDRERKMLDVSEREIASKYPYTGYLSAAQGHN